MEETIIKFFEKSKGSLWEDYMKYDFFENFGKWENKVISVLDLIYIVKTGKTTDEEFIIFLEMCDRDYEFTEFANIMSKEFLSNYGEELNIKTILSFYSDKRLKQLSHFTPIPENIKDINNLPKLMMME